MSEDKILFCSKLKSKFVTILICVTGSIMLFFMMFGNIFLGMVFFLAFFLVFYTTPTKVNFYINKIGVIYVFIKKDINYDKIKKVKVYPEGVYSGSTISLVTDKKQFSFDYGTDENLCGILNFLYEKGLKIVTNKNLRELVNVDFKNQIVFTQK